MSLRAEDDRAKLEKKVQEAQRLESLGVLADGIAHDLNNLLASILAHVELARSALPESAAAVHESLCRIEKVAGRAEGICSQILAYAGKGTSSIELVDVNEVIREMTELLKVAVPKSVRLDCQLAADLPPVRANVAQVRQVVMNLIVNAAEAIGAGDAKNGCTMQGGRTQGGLVTLATNLVTRPQRCVCLTVADTGKGMDADAQNRIFDPFYTTKSTGRGMGLATVRRIIQEHQGHIQIDSQPGRGTVFRVLLPVAG
ncbi:MAG: sensor histidine kinase [Planctomycetota bacterium]|jgi:signal transduction histidine kinase